MKYYFSYIDNPSPAKNRQDLKDSSGVNSTLKILKNPVNPVYFRCLCRTARCDLNDSHEIPSMQRGEFGGFCVAEAQLFQPRLTSGAHLIFERLRAGVTGGDVLRAPRSRG